MPVLGRDDNDVDVVIIDTVLHSLALSLFLSLSGYSHWMEYNEWEFHRLQTSNVMEKDGNHYLFKN